MKKTALTAAALLAVMAAGAATGAYPNPDPVSLPIENQVQETKYWCWAAIVRQLLQRPTYGRPPRQCELVNQANYDRRLTGDDCCRRPAGTACGDRLGDLGEVAGLIGRYGLKVEPRPAPETADSLYRSLLDGQVVLAGVNIAEGLNHLYLIKGIFWDDRGRARLLVNDPASPGVTTLDFEEARSTWLVTLTVF